MNNKKSFFLYSTLSLAFFLLALLFGMSQMRISNEALAARLSPHVLRFHIMANSDSATDQNIKLEVRSLVLDYLREHLSNDADKQETADWLKTHQHDIETLANRYLAQKHVSYNAHLELTNCYFPTRYYDGWTFPCGNYDAARITLGNGKGHNWWCVLYPRYCFVDEAREQKEKQDSALPLEKHCPARTFDFKFLSLFNRH